MAFKLFAIDFFFTNSIGSYTFDAQCEILKELGYDAMYLCLMNEAKWNDLPRLATVRDRYGIDVAGVYANVDIAGDDGHEGNRRILRMLETIEGCDSVELGVLSSDKCVKPSDPDADDKALAWLGRFLKVAERRSLSVVLYPHMYFWMERIEDAVRLCRKMDHGCLGVAFCGYHWFVVDGKDLVARLELAAPFLRSVNLCGCTMSAAGRKEAASALDKPVGFLPASVQLIHEGALDNFLILAALKRVGYSGKIGLQGYSIGGDAYGKLKESVEAFRSMVRRLDEHPEWGMFNPA